MTTIETRVTRPEMTLWLEWVIATTVGWVVGFAICEAFKAFLDSIQADGVVIGLSVGIAQWLVLRGRIGRAAWWILATVIGFGVGKWIGERLVEADPGIVGDLLSGVAIGVSVGVAQWLILRPQITRAAWWVVASVLAWAIGGGIITVAEEGAGGPAAIAYVTVAIGAALAGGLTGAVLVWLRRQDHATT
jgi:hypothetical protein